MTARSIRLVVCCVLMAALSGGTVALAQEASPGPARPPAQKPEKRESIDGTPYPPLESPHWWTDVRMPGLVNVFGSPPEKINNGRVHSLNAFSPVAQRAREYIGERGIDPTGYDWVTPQMAGYPFVLLRLTHGRVSGVLLADERKGDAWASTARRLGAAGGIREGGGFRVGQMSFWMRQSGRWEHEFKVHVKKIDGNVIREERSETHPAALHIEIDAYDFSIAANCSTRQAFEAVMARRVEIGMTDIEAYLALRDYRLGRVRQPDGSEQWIWYGEKVVPTKRTTVQVPSGETYIYTDSSFAERIVARAIIRDRRVESFEWVIIE